MGVDAPCTREREGAANEKGHPAAALTAVPHPTHQIISLIMAGNMSSSHRGSAPVAGAAEAEPPETSDIFCQNTIQKEFLMIAHCGLY